MSCVNKKSKEFKELAANNNVSANTLELIIHKYWLETGSEENFPTDVYIQAQLGNLTYKENIQEVRELWQKMYSSPMSYTSYEELQNAYQTALQYFPPEAVVYYKDRNGNYILSVKQPVSNSVALTANQYFAGFEGEKRYNLGIEQRKIYSADKVRELFEIFNTDRTNRYLADKVLNLAKKLNLQITFEHIRPLGNWKTGTVDVTGEYNTLTRSVRYNLDWFEKVGDEFSKAPTLIHELIHAATVYALDADNRNLTKELRKFRTEVNSIYNEVKDSPELKGMYGIKNIREFVAELSNPIFREKLKSIETPRKQNIWTRIVDAIKNLLGIHSSSPYYNRMMNALNTALDAFDLDSYMKYNGIKQPLQQAYNDHRVDFENMTEDELKSMLKATIKDNPRLKEIDDKIKKDEQERINKGIRAGGETFEYLYRLLHDNRRNNQKNQGETGKGKSLRERSHEEAARQQRLIEDWAKENNKLIVEPNDYYDEEYHDQSVSGSEAKVWYDSNKKVAVKNITVNHYGNIQKLLERIAIHNTAFPETAMKVTGIGISDNGISIIVEQPWVNSADNIPTLEEINDYMASQGFVHARGQGITAEYEKDGYLVSDIRPENVIKQPDGQLAVIDCFAQFTGEQFSAIDRVNRFLDTLSKDQLVSELNQIKQEYADYALLEDNTQTPQRPSRFTFNDGVTVNTPFTPNSQQAEALNVMNDFIHSGGTSMTLSGYAGTGKTSLMEIIAQKANRDGKNIIFCATTNKAAAVLNAKVSKQGFVAQTLNKVFGINVEVDPTKAYDTKNLISTVREADIPQGTTIFIDEASMINEENYNILNKVAKENGLKIIYVGDRAQLAPVGENKVSKVFRNADGKVVELTKVERTDDNAILKEATNIRNGRPLSQESSFNSEGKGVAFINPKGEHRQDIIEVINHYVQGLKKDPDYFRILAFTNKAIAQYNTYVRKQLGYTDNIPRVGEPIMGYTNWGYDYHTKTYEFVNSESYRVTAVGRPTPKTIKVNDAQVKMTTIPITLEDSAGNSRTFNFMDIKGNPANAQAAILLATMKKKLWEQARYAPRKQKSLYYSQINQIDQFLFVNDDIIDEQGHYLQNKTFDYGYATTVHKSQGSTFTHVLLDENNIAKAKGGINNAANALSVDLGEETSNDPSNATLAKAEDVDLNLAFSDESSATTAEQPSDMANMRQQLEYVGISRATDTVTVISSKAQREDTPLNHLKGKTVSTNTINSNDIALVNKPQSTDETTPDIEVSSRDQDNQRSDSNSANNTLEEINDNTLSQQTKEAIKTGKWDKQSVDEFNDFIKQIQDGEIVYRRVSKESEPFAEGISQAHAGATILLRGSYGTAETKSRNPKEQYDAEAAQGKEQEQQIESWAKAEDLWLNDYKDANGHKAKTLDDLLNSQWTYINQGSEAEVYMYDENNVLKSINLSHANDNVAKALDRIALFNHLFPNTAMQVVGFGRDSLGQFKIIVTQPFIKGKELTDIELNDFLKNLQESNQKGIYLTSNREERVADLGNYNVLKSDDGNYFVIDADVVYNTPYYGGEVTFENSFTIPDNNRQNNSIQDTSLKVPLPAYKSFTNNYEDTTVDATWKIPLLQELDGQLSNDNTAEQNQEIINRMNDILKASTEEDLKEISSQKEARIQKNLDEYEKLNTQFDNLLEGNLIVDEDNKKYFENRDYVQLSEFGAKFTASEIRHVAELIGNYLSDLITEIQSDGNKVHEFFPDMRVREDVDFTHMSRKDIADTIGMDNFINKAKQDVGPQSTVFDRNDVDYGPLKALLVWENWDAMMLLASDVFSMNEGFSIQRDYEGGRFNLNENRNQIAPDDFNGYQDEEIIEEQEGDSQEHWQVEQRTIDVLNSMSALVRQGIHECYVLDEHGNKAIDPNWKMPLRVNPRNAVNSILRWSRGSLSLVDMINKLQAHQARHPWVSQLITRLSDTTGRETDFQSQFYGVFTRPFQLYSIVRFENGKYSNMMVNESPSLSEAMSSIRALYQIGEHPLFNAHGRVKKEILGTPVEEEKRVKKIKNNHYGIYAPNEGKFTLHRAHGNLLKIQQEIDANIYERDHAQYHGYTFTGDLFSNENKEKAVKWLSGVYEALGYPVSEDILRDSLDIDTFKDLTNQVRFLVEALDSSLTDKLQGEYQPFTYNTKFNINSTVKSLLAPIADHLDDTAITAFYDSGKMYQSYVTPSFMTKLVTKFKTLQGQEFDDFLQNEYGNSEWFKLPGKGQHEGWRNWMLELLDTPLDKDSGPDLRTNPREVFQFKVELNFNKHNYMKNMSDSEYVLSLITEYFAPATDSKHTRTAWFRMPMQSNKPSSEFFKFYTIEGDGTLGTKHYKDVITGHLYDMFLQELSRIQTVRMRNRQKSDADFIKNFDTNGRRFNFLPFFNDYLETNAAAKAGRTLLRNEDTTVSPDNDRLATLLQRKVEGLDETRLSAEEEVELSNLAHKAIRTYMDNRATEILDDWQQSGIIDAARNVEHIVSNDVFLYEDEKDPIERNKGVRASLEKFIWNDYFMTKNILQLTVGDIAFYKDAEDLQKRLAQLHAPGTRGNAFATDYEGRRVSDGKYRTVMLKDFDNFISNIIDNISEVFDRKIAAAPEGQKAQLRAIKESLVGKNGKYRQINVTDAQGYSSPSSYRKKALIFGRWSRHAEEVYQKLLKGEYNYTDLEVAFQPLKPFVYTHLQKNLGVDSAPIHTMHVPFQAKNSEYLLIMADALLKDESLSRPNLLRAVYRVMEESERLNPTQGIDTIQFESAIKSGLQGAINIQQFQNMQGGEEAAYTYMMEQIYTKDAEGNRTKVYNTDTFVQETSYEDYCLQQEVPEHFKDHMQAHGSQIRMILPSDLDFIKDPKVSTDNPDNQVFYEWIEPDGTKRSIRADEFREEYEETIADNIAESLTNLRQEFHMNLDPNGKYDKRERNIALSKILQREILSSPRYGVDLLQACSVDKQTGEFRMPKGDPIQAKRIEQLINSVIKNRVNKQKIAGGPIVQVTNFGTSKQLHIRFNDRQGGILKTKEEFEADTALKEQYNTYSNYTKERQAGIAYFEVFAPIWDDKLVEDFADEQGNIDMEALENAAPDLLQMVSYRIPTEDKYSMAPMKVVGFMPREAGDAIMLPYELTEIDDSDFDVDKRYVMRRDYPIVKKSRQEIFSILHNALTESFKQAHEGKITKEQKKWRTDEVNMFLDNPSRMKNSSSLQQYLSELYRRNAWTVEKPTSGREYRNNKIIDMTLAVLTNEMTADKILNPGGFDLPKEMGYRITAYKNLANTGISWNALQNKSIDELKDLSYKAKDLAWADTQVQFYRQNSASSSLIGVFAVNKTAHAVLEGNGIKIAINEIVDGGPFTIAGKTFGDKMLIDGKEDDEGTLIGKTLGSLVAASADGVKDPILNLMNINMTTANVLNTMLRLGMPFDKAALFLSQDVITRALKDFNTRNLSNYVPLNKVIQDFLESFETDNNITPDSHIKTEELKETELIEGLLPTEHASTDYKVLLALQKLLKISEAMRNPTFATRFNSISSAVGPLIIDNLMTEHRMEQFGYGVQSDEESSTHFYTTDIIDGESMDIPVDMDDIFADHPILREFAQTVGLAKELFEDMPAGSEQFKTVLNALPKAVRENVYRDKKLLSSLSDFYQSYLLVASGLIDYTQLKSMIDDFPAQFMKAGYKEKYPNNALIQAIKINTPRKSGKAQLEIKITGMDTRQKEDLSSAWVDLHKENPELSQKLFAYNFFRAGIGFSPKTFMALVPMYVKEHLTSEDGTTSYVDTYRHFPPIIPETVVDQFIRNNWDNNKLVPWKGGKGTHYSFDYKEGTVKVRDAKEIADLKDVKYMKTKGFDETHLWKQEGKGDDLLIYKEVKPLGDNGRYLEMSPEEIRKAITQTTQPLEDNAPAELSEQSITEDPAPEVNNEGTLPSATKEFVELYLKQTARYGKTGEDALNTFEDIKKNPKQYAGFLQNVFKQKGLTLNKEEAVTEFKKYC